MVGSRTSSPLSQGTPRSCLPSWAWNGEWELITEKQRDRRSGQKAQAWRAVGILPRVPPSPP